VFENLADVPNFERAIAESLPDEKLVNNLKDKIKAEEKELHRIRKELEKLVDLALSGTLTRETIKVKEQTLIETKAKLEQTLQTDKDHLRSLPDVDMMKKEAERIRRELLEQYSGQDRLKEMTFEDKKQLLHWLFDGKDQKGTPYGIYINKTDKGIDYFMYGRITGLRTLRGDDINYMEDELYKTNKVAKIEYLK
jgi:Skp family chaperone for outer membrane proteins